MNWNDDNLYHFIHTDTEGELTASFEEIQVGLWKKNIGDAKPTLVQKNGFTEDEERLRSLTQKPK